MARAVFTQSVRLRFYVRILLKFYKNMSITFEPNLYVRIVELENGPAPLPLANGFTTERAYRVLGLYTASETGEAYLILPNDREEMWFISNRHIRIKGIFPDTKLHIDFQNGAS